MGRAFDTELTFLNSTYSYSLDRDTKVIECYLKKICNYPVLSIGSGGSFSAAKAFEFFYQKAGFSTVAKAITPFELRNYSSVIKKNAIALLTAGGNNPDTVNAFRFLVELEPKELLVICTRSKSKIHRLVQDYSDIFFCDGKLPSGKDGFLSVNSLFATITMLAKAFNAIVPNNEFFSLDKSFDFDYRDRISEGNDNIEKLRNSRTFVVLHGGLSTNVAFDLESKFSEAALGAVQLADYRNFAHGRHHWLSQPDYNTCIISLISPNEESIANKTLELLPNNIPVIKIRTKKDNVIGVLELLAQVFWYTLLLGNIRNIDPGRPHVPEYGKKLYHVSYNLWAPHKSNPYKSMSQRAAYRKCSVNNILFDNYEQSFRRFSQFVEKRQFRGIVFDYDGTLKNNTDKHFPALVLQKLMLLLENNIQIGIATGRGKSVRVELRNVLPSRYWSRIFVAYYNGGEVARLDDDFAPNTKLPPNPELEFIADRVSRILPDLVIPELRPKQLTILNNHSCCGFDFEAIVRDICSEYKNINIWKSGHSLDIVTNSSSKLNILDTFDDNCNVLTIGDSGELGGNDFELLSHKYSFSVNRVSNSFQSCWNCAPFGLRGPAAMIYYFNSVINICDNYFELDLK